MTGKRPRILIAEEDPGVLKMLQTRFELEGYLVITAQDGRAVMESIGETAPDVLLLNLPLPLMNGFEIMESLGPSSTLPIVAFSADRGHGDAALKLGARAFFTKPFDLDRLAMKVRDLLGAPD